MSDYSQAAYSFESSRPTDVGVRSFASIFLPSLSSVVFVVALLQVLFLSQGTQGLFRDSDTGWHIRNGEAIIAMRAVPSTDSFSYGCPNAPWLAWEWLADSVIRGMEEFDDTTIELWMTRQ